MKRKTGFFFDERCFWHSTGLHAVTLPVGGWVQPPAGGGHAESPETKRRMKNLMDVAGLTAQLQLRGGAAAGEEETWTAESAPPHGAPPASERVRERRGTRGKLKRMAGRVAGTSVVLF